MSSGDNTSNNGSSSSDDFHVVDEYLRRAERAAEVDAAAMYRVLDNQLLHTDRVIANLSALKTIQDDSLLRAALGNPP